MIHSAPFLPLPKYPPPDAAFPRSPSLLEEGVSAACAQHPSDKGPKPAQELPGSNSRILCPRDAGLLTPAKLHDELLGFVSSGPCSHLLSLILAVAGFALLCRHDWLSEGRWFVVDAARPVPFTTPPAHANASSSAARLLTHLLPAKDRGYHFRRLHVPCTPDTQWPRSRLALSTPGHSCTDLHCALSCPVV